MRYIMYTEIFFLGCYIWNTQHFFLFLIISFYHYLLIHLYNFSILCFKINNHNKFIYLILSFLFFNQNFYLFGKWNIDFSIFCRIFFTLIYAYFTKRARLLGLALLYKVWPIYQNDNLKSFKHFFFYVLYDILSKHYQYPEHLGYLDEYRLFTMVIL